MKWEELPGYKLLKKEEIKTAYVDFTKVVDNYLIDSGFTLKGRKLVKQSNDLFHIMHLDTRGSWMGVSDSFKTEISICSIYDRETFILNYELTASKSIESLIPKIRNYYRITQEYPLLAEFLSRKIKEKIIPYFSKYQSSKDVLKNRKDFKLDNLTDITERNSNLLLYCELANKINKSSSIILQNRLNRYEKFKLEAPIATETRELLTLIEKNDWDNIEKLLLENKKQVFKKLKIKDI